MIRFDPDQTRRMTLGHESFNLDMPVGIAEDQTTFLMSSPGAEVAQTSPIPDESTMHAVADEAQQDPAPDVVLGESGSDAGAGGVDFDNEGFEYVVGGFDDDSSIEEEEPLRQEPEREPTQITSQIASKTKTSLKARKKQKRISKHGVEYPALPPSFVKRVAQTALQSSGLGNQRISPDTLEALSQASEWFFEQLGDDLGAYANHAKRKTIEESDVFTLMKRYVGGISSYYFAQVSNIIVQATPSRIPIHRLLLGAEAPPAGTHPGAEDADAAARQAAARQEDARGCRRRRYGT